MTPTFVVILGAFWLLVGLTTGVWMIRRGHDRLWLVISLILGPLFVPIALERAERGPRLAEVGPAGLPGPRSQTPGGVRVLVGLDGSSHSDQVLTTTLEMLGPHCQLLVLAEVVCFESMEFGPEASLEAARKRLARAADRAAEAGITAVYEVLAGPVGETLRQFAEEQDMDLLVVGRRGRGLSPRPLGSVSADLVHHSTLPVLVVEP